MLTKKTHGNKLVYGIRNSAAFNVKYEGDEYWYETRDQRNRALHRLRERGIAMGLAPSAAQAGIVPIRQRFAELVVEMGGDRDFAEFRMGEGGGF